MEHGQTSYKLKPNSTIKTEFTDGASATSASAVPQGITVVRCVARGGDCRASFAGSSTHDATALDPVFVEDVIEYVSVSQGDYCAVWGDGGAGTFEVTPATN